MEHRTKRDLALINLVSDFETNYEQGNVEYLDEKTLYQLIDFYEDEYLLEKAIEVVDLALEQYKYRSDFYIIKARLLLNNNHIGDCISYLDKAEAIAPFENEIIVLRARALSAKGEFDAALYLLDSIRSFAVEGDMIDIYLCEAFIFQHMKVYDAMMVSLEEALNIDPENQEALQRMHFAVEMSRQFHKSIEIHERVIDQNPYNYLAWYNLGHAYFGTWEYDLSLQAFEFSFIINPNFKDAYEDCAEICCQLQKYNKALDVYLEADEIFGPDSDLLVKIAYCQLQLGDVEASKHVLFKAIRYDHYNDEAYYYLARCFAANQNWYSAINAYHKAIDIEEKTESYYLGLAKAYVAVEEYNKATVNFQIAVKKGPELNECWTEYICFLLKLGLYDESLQMLDEAEANAFGADLLYCRAMTMFFLKDKTEGMAILEEALVEDFEMHKMIFEVAPEIELDNEIMSMIKYFEGEEKNNLD